jgi:hypothetical protein
MQLQRPAPEDDGAPVRGGATNDPFQRYVLVVAWELVAAAVLYPSRVNAPLPPPATTGSPTTTIFTIAVTSQLCVAFSVCLYFRHEDGSWCP